MLTLACLFLACTQPFPTAPDDGPLLTQAGGDVTITYECGNTFVFRNRSTSEVALTWRVRGNHEQGSITLPARPATAEYSEAKVTTTVRGPLQVFRDGRRLVTVPNGHKTDCQVVTPFPSEVPDSVPDWVYADSNLVVEDTFITGVYPRGIVVVGFTRTSTVEERGALVASINAEVVGGLPGRVTPNGRTTDYYYLWLRGDRSSVAMEAARARLEASPIVAIAMFDFQVDALYREANDGAGWMNWSVDGTASNGQTWGLEAIRAPLAWRCEVGSSSTKVGVVDVGFTNLPELSANTSPDMIPSWTTGTRPHGTFVASVLAAKGNNQAGMTGVMWDAGLLLSHTRKHRGTYLPGILTGLEEVSQLGARVVNLSFGFSWEVQMGRPPIPSSSSDQRRRDNLANALNTRLTLMRQDGLTPLVVIAAGNDGVDASWAGFPLAAAGPEGGRVLVVGASNISNQLVTRFNSGPLVSVFAPGDDVYGLDDQGTPYAFGGTSYAAPYVTGVAGLLFSLDPTLTAEQVAQFITAGAVRRNVRIGTRYLLDAYEPLKLAAEKQGVPLCGNRLWNEGTEVVAARGPGGRETIADLATAPAGYILPFHGGRKVVVQNADTWDYTLYELQGSTWTSLGEWDWDDSEVGGSGLALFGVTHDRDSVVFISGSALYIGVRFNQPVRKVTDLPTEAVQSGGELCLREVRTSTGWDCVETTWFGTTTFSSWMSGASPVGDSLVYLKKRYRRSASSRLGAVDCSTGGPVTDGSNCRRYLTSNTTTELEGEVVRVERNSGNRSVILTLPGRFLVSVTGSEDGGSLAVASEVWNGGGPVADCRTDFYSLPLSAVPTPDASYPYGPVCFGLDWQGGFGAVQEDLAQTSARPDRGFALRNRLQRAAGM